MTRTTKTNSILGGIFVVLLLLAVGYYASNGTSETAQNSEVPSTSDTAQTPAPGGSDPTSTGSTDR